MRRTLYALVTMALLSGCDGSNPLIVGLRDDRGAAARVVGSWTGTATVAGRTLAFTLSVQDTIVTGIGTYSSQLESGDLDLQGAATRSGVRLDLFFDDLSTAHFVGTQPSSVSLSGTLSFDPINGPASSELVTFTKQ